MKKLRLLYTTKCNRSCAGCCNNDYDLMALPTISPRQAATEFDLVMITGGEPMLYANELATLIKYMKDFNPKLLVYVYTAKINNIDDALRVLRASDGITLTLHAKKDRKPFFALHDILATRTELIQNKSLRLNIFKEVGHITEHLPYWMTKRDMEWIQDCPVPDDETFMRIENTII